MPANRSRTERWRESLAQIYERHGGLELSVAKPGGAPADDSKDLIWRVRILGLSDVEIVVERPTAMGQPLPIATGVELIAAMSIGQNRWMFRTRVMGCREATMGRGQPASALRLSMPADVERCMRRNFYRTATATLNLPKVQCWPLLDPGSAIAAEIANRTLVLGAAAGTAASGMDQMLLPEVGPMLTARLINLGGGGAGLLVDKSEHSSMDRVRLLWLRLDLTPQVPAPIGMTARVAHTHLDSEQNLYAGLAFEFAFNPAHQRFVVDQICRYVASLQAAQEQIRERRAA